MPKITTRQTRNNGRFAPGRQVVGVSRVDITEPMRALRVANAEMGEAVSDRLDFLAETMENYAKNEVPAPVDSGAYRESIRARVDRRGSNAHRFQARIQMTAGDPAIRNNRGQPTTMYAYLLEAGSSGIAPNGIIGPTFKRFEPNFSRIAAEAVKQVLREARRRV